MAVRPTMAALIARVRLLINDPAGANQQFLDQDLQDILDESRVDVFNQSLRTEPTFTGSTIQFLDYFSDLGGWEDGLVLKQYLTTVVTPSLIEPISGHFQFAQTTLPPVCVTGRLYDVYRAAADLLERQSARWMLSYSVSVDGQSLQRSQVVTMILDLAHTYRLKQRAGVIDIMRGDMVGKSASDLSLGPTEVDYMGDGSGH